MLYRIYVEDTTTALANCRPNKTKQPRKTTEKRKEKKSKAKQRKGKERRKEPLSAFGTSSL